MLQTTLCYLEKDGKYLMLHRTAKDKDINKDKWIGVGGKFEPGETPEECLLREVYEETGLTLESYRFRGILTFCCDGAEEYIFLYTADRFSGTLILYGSVGAVEQALAQVNDMLNRLLQFTICPVTRH